MAQNLLTTLTSKSKTIRIHRDQPTVIIGERINPTGRKVLAQEMAAGDFSRVEKDALAHDVMKDILLEMLREYQDISNQN